MFMSFENQRNLRKIKKTRRGPYSGLVPSSVSFRQHFFNLSYETVPLRY
jgi:hypothetical protein